MQVATVQMASRNNAADANLDTALEFIEQAVRAGAQLVLLPELMSTGYGWTPEIWDAAESSEGKTVQWMKSVSRQLGIYLGTTYMEAVDGDFYNSFVLTGPDGRECGRVRKRCLPAYEAFFFKAGNGPQVIKTAIGNIGVGICYDAWHAFLPRAAQEEDFDLLLLPHSSPIPQKRKHIEQQHIDRFIDDVRQAATRYASLLGIPVVLSNKCGDFESAAPMGPYERTTFPGFSAIADSKRRAAGAASG